MKTSFEKFFLRKGEFSQMELTLRRIQNALRESGFDEKKLGKIIHVAGTNGKGSTCYFLDQILRQNNFKTVTYTSPHIMKINERIKLNGKNVSNKVFDTHFNKLKKNIENNNLTYFEALTLTAFSIFQEFLPDVSIIETGLGGKYDATNALEVKIPVITTISQDHINFLGASIYNIIHEKIGIVKNNSRVYLGKNCNFITNHIKENLKGKEIILVENESESNKFKKPFSFNLNLATQVAQKEFGIPNIDYLKLKLPYCRGEKVHRFLLDGAHNPSGLMNLLKYISENKLNINTAIISSTNDRDILKFIKILSDKINRIIVTEIPDNLRSINTENMNFDKNTVVIKNCHDAIKRSLQMDKDGIILVCGSLYLCSIVRKIIKGRKS